VICDLIDSRFSAGDENVTTVAGDIARPAVAGQVIAEAVSRWGPRGPRLPSAVAPPLEVKDRRARAAPNDVRGPLLLLERQQGSPHVVERQWRIADKGYMLHIAGRLSSPTADLAQCEKPPARLINSSQPPAAPGSAAASRPGKPAR